MAHNDRADRASRIDRFVRRVRWLPRCAIAHQDAKQHGSLMQDLQHPCHSAAHAAGMTASDPQPWLKAAQAGSQVRRAEKAAAARGLGAPNY
ncbi:MAG: hypothetical protein ACODAQ_01210 [Phycisphaeraceae bacterium]